SRKLDADTDSGSAKLTHYPPAIEAAVHFRGQKVNIGRRYITGDFGIEEGFTGFRLPGPRTRWSGQAYSITAELYEQGLDYINIQLGRGQPAKLGRYFAQGEFLAVGTVAEHGIKRVRHGHDFYRHGNFII